MSRVKVIELQQMAPLRDVSQKISQFLKETLTAYITPLSPLLSPGRILGEYLEGHQRERIPGAEKVYNELEQQYVSLCRNIFRLPSQLRAPLPAMKTKLDVYPWEYHYQIGGNPNQTITISSPVKWVLTYENPFTLSSLLKGHLSGEKPQLDDVKRLLINNITLSMMMDRSQGLKKILTDLRFPVTVDTSPVSGDLPYVVVEAPVESFRPQDDLMNMVVQLSGRPVFEELVDMDQIRNLRDPLSEQIAAFLG